MKTTFFALVLALTASLWLGAQTVPRDAVMNQIPIDADDIAASAPS